MYYLDFKRGTELDAEAEAVPIDRSAIWDAVVLGEPIPEHVTRERLALEMVLMMRELSAADLAVGMARERFVG